MIFVLEKDIRSSVPRLTLSLNKSHWVDESVDIYELINNEFEPDKKFTKLRRNAIKDFHMSCYFDEGSDAVIFSFTNDFIRVKEHYISLCDNEYNNV